MELKLQLTIVSAFYILFELYQGIRSFKLSPEKSGNMFPVLNIELLRIILVLFLSGAYVYLDKKEDSDSKTRLAVLIALAYNGGAFLFNILEKSTLSYMVLVMLWLFFLYIIYGTSVFEGFKSNIISTAVTQDYNGHMFLNRMESGPIQHVWS